MPTRDPVKQREYERRYFRKRQLLPYGRFCRQHMHWACRGQRGQRGQRQRCECPCHQSGRENT